MIGVFEGCMCFVANYWDFYLAILDNNFYCILAVSFDMCFWVQNDDYFGFGISVMCDEVGLANFNWIKVNIGGLFLKQFGGFGYCFYMQYLVAGVQVGFGQYGLNWQWLWFFQ